jgi:hypothetical protein
MSMPSNVVTAPTGVHATSLTSIRSPVSPAPHAAVIDAIPTTTTAVERLTFVGR